MKKIIIYTDGAAKGNPGNGGYGIVMKYGSHRKEISEGFRKTTNNRMELLAVIIALENIKKKCPVEVYSDSKYVVDSISKGWLFGWVKKAFKGKKNKDLWERYLSLHYKFELKYIWVKGHANNIENERCDVLAVEAAEGNGPNAGNLSIDAGFESGQFN
jgi:ribonuclease HI